MYLKYPVYKAALTDMAEDGILRISLVDKPAVESDFEAYDKEIQMYAVDDEEERMITGCFLRADYPILRRDEEGNYFYITFSKDVIKVLTMKWLSENRANIINTDHKENTEVDGMFLQEVFIKDAEKGINPSGFEDVEDGSAFATYKVQNDEVWESIKEGTWKGFSVEIINDLVPAGRKEESVDELMDDIIEMMNKYKELTNK